ncbi:IS3 family transposase [Corallococcus sp. BB11-1]|uniref:IS3 family transposase n=1 Tax=Corallococcus sp. BB11-1 TaxID=2996783 RepID=UPI00226E9D13|nr:IS3 family transposase [Corallococcus sp. BB11-1]MCY1037017.1 IS3 family transposase [Corallococcus sp. BB11-1]
MMEKKTHERAPEGPESKRRRRYSAEEKLRLVAECEAPGSNVSLVARKYGVNASLLFRWRQLKESGGVSGLQAGEAVVPESEVQALKAQVRELQRLLGKKTQEAEILRDAVELAREKKTIVARGLVQAGRHSVSAVARALAVARSTLHRPLSPRQPRRPDAQADAEVLEELKTVVGQRATYGYRRACAVLTRQRRAEGRPGVNHKRVYRLMRQGRLLLQRHTGKPTRTHEGQVVTLKSNLRWCSDGFEVRCWNGERVHVAFSLDCCDREAIAFQAAAQPPTALTIQDLMVETLEARFGPGTAKAPHPVEWLSDNGPVYTAKDTRDFGLGLGLRVCTTPSYSPQSNGMAEAFVKTFKRDYVYVNELHSAAHVLAQLPAWFDDYNRCHPHRGLKMKSPREFRTANSQP